jgi:hypothetical protein
MNRAITRRQAEALRQDITRTRADLRETVQVLAERADIPSRARASTGRLMEEGRTLMRTHGQWLVLAGGVAGALVAAVIARQPPVRRWVRRTPRRARWRGRW